MESSLWHLITVFKYLRGYHLEERDLSGVEPEEKIKTKGESYKENRIRAHEEKKGFAPGVMCVLWRW